MLARIKSKGIAKFIFIKMNQAGMVGTANACLQSALDIACPTLDHLAFAAARPMSDIRALPSFFARASPPKDANC
jgi:hypothetical protein